MVVKVFLKERGHQTEDVLRLRRVLAEVEHEGYKVEFYDPDSAKGEGLAEVYDVVAPSVLIVRENGSEIFAWRGEVPKSAGDLRYFLGHGIGKLSPTRINMVIKRPGEKKKSTSAPKKPTVEKYELKKERFTLKRGKAATKTPKKK